MSNEPPLTFTGWGRFSCILDRCRDEARHPFPSSKGILMQNITIGRYKRDEHLHTAHIDIGDKTTSLTVDVADLFDGWIEGVRDDGSTWIMWLDAHGSPVSFWADRDPEGGVEGEPINLSRESDGTDQPS